MSNYVNHTFRLQNENSPAIISQNTVITVQSFGCEDLEDYFSHKVFNISWAQDKIRSKIITFPEGNCCAGQNAGRRATL